MRFLANENIPGALVKALRGAGNDVIWIRTEAPGIHDQEVLARAARDGRILLTFDKDFGELAKASGLLPRAELFCYAFQCPVPMRLDSSLRA